jgi:hypothetical protein
MSTTFQSDVCIENHGSLFVFQPLTPAARTWIEENVSEESTWWAGALVVEPRYARDLAAGMLADGLHVA